MSHTRPAAVDGMFYPANRNELQACVNQMLEDSGRSQYEPVALIVPHAGFVYSGSVAASAFTALRNVADRIQRVVVIGPAHREFVRGLVVPSVDAFETPLGTIPLDREQIDLLSELPFVQISDSAHEQEHCIEVELPFLQTLLNRFSLIPVLVGEADGEQVKTVIDLCLQTPGTFVVISSDLSHFLDYQTAQDLDSRTVRAIELLKPSHIAQEQACGRTPVLGLMAYAQEHTWAIHNVDLKNSGDTAGSRDRVVGYGAFVVCRENTNA